MKQTTIALFTCALLASCGAPNNSTSQVSNHGEAKPANSKNKAPFQGLKDYFNCKIPENKTSPRMTAKDFKCSAQDLISKAGKLIKKENTEEKN